MFFYHTRRCKELTLFCASLLIALTLFTNAYSQARFERPAEVDAAYLPQHNGAPHAAARPSAARRETEPSDGNVDPAFAPTFDVATGFAYTVEEMPDGKLLVAGSFKSINGVAEKGIFRLNADRSIDMTFSAKVRGSIFRMAVQTDGKILIGGAFVAFNATASRSGVARLNTDGSLDTTFDVGAGPDGLVRDMILQPDGKLVVSGEFRSFNLAPQFGIARLNTDGSLDVGFTSPLQPSSIFAAAAVSCVGLQADGKLVLGGAMYLTFGGGQVYWVLRLNADGSVDNSFTPPTMNSNPWELAIQPDGKIVLGGFFTTISATSRPRIARLNTDGSLDATFNPGTGANSSVLFIRVLASGKLMISGTFATINGTARGGLALLNTDGSLDGSFVPAGTTTGTVYSVTPAAGGGYFASGSFSRIAGADRNTLVLLGSDGSVNPNLVISSLQISTIRAAIPQADGKMLVGGSFNRVNGAAANSILRLNANGTVDPTFSSGVTIAGSVLKIITQPDGKLLLVGGGLRINGGTTSSMVRLNADGSHDSSFTLATISQISGGSAAAVQPDGKILFAYSTFLLDPLLSSGLVRLNSDGSIDGTFAALPRPIESLAVLPDGKIMAAGPFAFAYVSSVDGTYEPHNAIMRLNSDGAHDRTFRSALTTEGQNFSAAYSMHVQADGRILLGGRLFAASSTSPFGVVRLNATGTLDGSFQQNVIASQFGITNVFSIHVAPDGKVLIGGYFDNFGGPGRSNVARLQSNGAIDTTFTAAADYSVSVVTRETSGNVLIGGGFEQVNGVARTSLARLLTAPVEQNDAPFDFDGDGKTDIGIFRPGVAEWWINRSSDGNTFATQFGATTDKIVPADYTGDGKADIAFWRPSTGEWYVLRSEDFSFFAFPFGTNGDVPVPADYDADGKTDPAVFRASTATWFIRRSSDNGTTIEAFGAAGDIPVPGDYDGDNKADLAIFRPSNGQWWLNRSTSGVIATTFGDGSDKPVQGDYTGDGKTDVAFWRPTTGDWFVLRSEDFSFFSFPFGTTGDTPAPGDYDGDGKHDATVFRSSNATWYSNRSTAGTLIQQFGQTGDRPVPNAFVP